MRGAHKTPPGFVRENDVVDVNYSDRLREVGILHDTAQTAAQKVNEVWDRVEPWWGKGKIQVVREMLCQAYAHTSNTWWLEWARNPWRL
jgi:putative transferase (TIGR04331 family)